MKVLCRNFSCISGTLKEQFHFTFRSLVEYGCICWNPCMADLTHKLEKVQNRAVKFVLSNYNKD